MSWREQRKLAQLETLVNCHILTADVQNKSCVLGLSDGRTLTFYGEFDLSDLRE